MQTIEIKHPELTKFVAAYDRENETWQEGPFAPHHDSVRTVETSVEAFYMLRDSRNGGLAREMIMTDAGDVRAHFLYWCDNERTLCFVPSDVAGELIPHLQADGGGCSTLGTIEWFGIQEASN